MIQALHFEMSTRDPWCAAHSQTRSQTRTEGTVWTRTVGTRNVGPSRFDGAGLKAGNHMQLVNTIKPSIRPSIRNREHLSHPTA